jgi:protein-S-isoprenylcysteine O-methyltransferase Ste14
MEEQSASAETLEKARYVPDRLARHRIKITVGVFLVVLATEIALGLQPRNPLDLSDPWVAAGTVLVALGLLIRSWAAGTLVKKKKLANDGPYSLVRHPLYLGSTLMMLGFTLLTGMWWNLIVAALTALVCFGHAIRNEEAFLAAKFGDRWTKYASHTGRILPRGLAGRLLAPWDGRRWLRNREYNAWIGTLCGWLGLWWWSL